MEVMAIVVRVMMNATVVVVVKASLTTTSYHAHTASYLVLLMSVVYGPAGRSISVGVLRIGKVRRWVDGVGGECTLSTRLNTGHGHGKILICSCRVARVHMMVRLVCVENSTCIRVGYYSGSGNC